MRSVNGFYQFVKETRGADCPDMWFPEPVPEPRVTAVDRAERDRCSGVPDQFSFHRFSLDIT